MRRKVYYYEAPIHKEKLPHSLCGRIPKQRTVHGQGEESYLEQH